MSSFYEDVLRKDVQDYKGAHENVIKLAPELYRLVSDLLFDRDIEQQFRSKLLTSIGYFIIPQDLYPEDQHGAIGYVDDLMLLITVIREISDRYGEEKILLYWKEDSEILKKVTTEYYYSLTNDYKLLFEEVIQFVGF
jgi:uncharacterized membrane protein YkvA (DUF1232 family)